MSQTLYDLIPRGERPGNDVLLGQFLEYTEGKRLRLYPAQETAILELFEEKNVILNTPTGSGKSLVAAALHFKAVAQGKRSIYTCPIKALVNEKWLALCREFGPENVGLSTGDASVNRDAPILCCTAEILSNIALREGPQANFQEVVMDEFHYYADRERGVAWQVPLLTLPQARFLLMSATLGDTTFFEEELTKRNGRPTVSVQSIDRPVPLEYAYSEITLAQTLERLASEGKSPVYVVHFTQLEAAQSAQDFTSINVCTREEKNAIGNELEGFKFTSPYGPEIRRWLKHGIGLHHAGLLPKYRVLVEQLTQKGLLKVICGTDTLGAGINMPIRTVLFTRLCKYDGQKTGILSARDFHQISGRAGRKGFDDRGWVVAQAPEHVIENIKLDGKAAKDGRKPVKRKQPERNFVNWDKQTFLRLMHAPPEKLTSRFLVSHGMLLNVLSRKGDGCRAMQRLIRDCHETPKAKKEHVKRAWQLFRSLLDRRIIEFVSESEIGEPIANAGAFASPDRPIPLIPTLSQRGREDQRPSGGLSGSDGFADRRATTPPLPSGEGRGEGDLASQSKQTASSGMSSLNPKSDLRAPTPASSSQQPTAKLRVNVDLQDDFSMDQALSLYLLDTLPSIDPQAVDYPLVLLTLVESILEDPDLILRKQLDKLKTQKMAEMKMAGIEYDERMEELEKLEYPKPNREFVYSTFNAFADKHPWVGQENIRPKSIAREMFENFRSFSDYIRDYELQRSEGLLLRHLNSVFKVLAQTVPDATKTDTVREMELYLGTLIRQVDSSLLEEWEKMRDPNYRPGAAAKEARPPGAEEAAADITRDTKAFTAAIRNRIFTFLRGLVNRDFETAMALLQAPPGVAKDSLAEGASASLSSSGGEGRGEEAVVGATLGDAHHTTPPGQNLIAGNSEETSSPQPASPHEAREKPVDAEGQPWTAARLQQALDDYHAGHEHLCLDPNARNLRHTYVKPSEDKRFWRVQQMLVDPEEHNDWVAEFDVDLAESRNSGEPVMRLRRIGSLV